MNLTKSAFPKIQEYKDYRLLLKEMYEAEKTHHAGINLNKFSSKLNMSSSAFRHIASGTRNLTIENIHNIASVFLFSFEEREFFESLVLWNQSKSPEEKSYYHTRMGSLKDKFNEQVVHLPATKTLSQWYVPAIIVYIKDHGKWNDQRTEFSLSKEQLLELSKSFNLSEFNLKKVVSKIREIPNLFTKDKKSIQIIMDKKSSDNAQMQYLLSVNQNGINRIQRNFHRKDCYFVACSANLTREAFSSLKEKLRSLIDQEVTSVDPTSKDLTLHQMNFNIYPID